ncbi:response regulator transcription factor [Bacillus sp. SG-1]|uniref:response regulator transcription factor n=1 Tax=Bacillus sp. SG-1 TaxID=161544 RepID=UPI000154482C|nr:response regulator [Bacillus sp. SG-1]EDL62755.1 two-component response regulator [Bacillus sp. SG-1]
MKKILLAEDEDVLRMLIMDTLEDEGYEIHEAADGEEAESLAVSTKFDLILLDYMMPLKTGLEVIKIIRGDNLNKDTKIMMLTAKSQKSDERTILEAGADYFLSKPFSPMLLAEKVEEILTHNE